MTLHSIPYNKAPRIHDIPVELTKAAGTEFKNLLLQHLNNIYIEEK